MLKIFQPDYIFLILMEITPIWLKSRSFTALILDVDNTLLSRKAEYLPAKHKLWLGKLLQAGIKITLVTNSGGPKVKMLEDSTGLKVVNWAAKPLPFAFQRALKNLSVPKEQVLVVGDQLFTDVLGAHLSGLEAAWVRPLDGEDFIVTSGMRKLEKQLWEHWETEQEHSNEEWEPCKEVQP